MKKVQKNFAHMSIKKKLDRVANIYISQLKKNFILLFFYRLKLSAILAVFAFKILKNLIEFILNYPDHLSFITSTTLVFLSCKKYSFGKKSYVPPEHWKDLFRTKTKSCNYVIALNIPGMTKQTWFNNCLFSISVASRIVH